MDNNNLPSKKFVIIVSLIAVIVLIISVADFQLPSSQDLVQEDETAQEALPADTTVSAQDLLADEPPLVALDRSVQQVNDQDGDGLQDWEELLWNTSPTNPDSDGNGVNDGDQVAAVKARLTQDRESLESEIDPNKDDLTTTDRIARDSYTTVATVSQIRDVSQEDVDFIAATTVDQTKKQLFSDKLTTSDLNTVANDSESVADYIFLMDGAIQKNGLNVTEVEAMNRYLIEGYETGQFSAQARSMIATQQLFVDDILSIPVPLEAVDLHLDMVNRTKAFISICDAILSADRDPLVAYASLFEYQDTTNDLFDTYIALGEYTEEVIERLN